MTLLRNGSVRLFSILLLFTWTACSNDLEEVKAVNATKDSAQEILHDAILEYTDSGRVKAKLSSPELMHFTEGRKGYLFPKGLQVEFFDKQGHAEARVNALYGSYQELDGMLELQKNVRFINFKQSDTLLTEYLIWDRKSRKVFTNQAVEMRSPRGILIGDGLTARENLTQYRWTNPRGKFYVNETDTTDDNTP